MTFLADDFSAIARRMQEIGAKDVGFVLPAGIHITLATEFSPKVPHPPNMRMLTVLYAHKWPGRITVADIKYGESMHDLMKELEAALRPHYPSVLRRDREIYIGQEDCLDLIKQIKRPA